MAYKSDDMGMGAGEETVDQGMPSGDKAMVDVTALIPPDMNVKDGEVLEFRVHRQGDVIMAEYNTGKESEGSWEDDFRKSMSPREGGPEEEQEGY